MPHRAPLSAVVASALGAPAFAQCQPEWIPMPPGIEMNDSITVLASFQGDLIAGGKFTEAGGTPANHIARWDGERWWPLGPGLGLRPDDIPHALLPYEQHLIAGGWRLWHGAYHVYDIARWDGREWSPVATQTGQPWQPWLPTGALVAHDGVLVAGGEHLFYSSIGQPLFHHVAQWDGDHWRPLGPGTSSPEFSVYDLLSHAGELFAARHHVSGPPDGEVVRWDGVQWLPTGPLVAPPWPSPLVTDLAVYEQQVVASGPGVPVLAWDGSTWTELGAPAPDGGGLALFQGELFTGMTGFTFALAAWNGSNWRYIPPGPFFNVVDMTVHDNQLFVASQVWPFWARWGCACYADCDDSGSATVADFACFQTQFVSGSGYADCDNSGALTVADFGCFQTKFVAGCP